MTKTLECMAIDEGKKCVSNEEKKKIQNAKKTESDRAQRLAEQIADHLHAMGIEEQKAKKGWDFFYFFRQSTDHGHTMANVAGMS